MTCHLCHTDPAPVRLDWHLEHEHGWTYRDAKNYYYGCIDALIAETRTEGSEGK